MIETHSVIIKYFCGFGTYNLTLAKRQGDFGSISGGGKSVLQGGRRGTCSLNLVRSPQNKQNSSNNTNKSVTLYVKYYSRLHITESHRS